MSAPFNNARSKLNRAIAAWLVNQNCGGVADILPANSVRPKSYPNTTIRSTIGKPEAHNVGLYTVNVQVSIKGSAVVNNAEPNPEVSRVNFDNRVEKTFDALMQSDNGGQSLIATANSITVAGRALAVDASNGADPVQKQFAANNADMVDFTCVFWYDDGMGDGQANEEGCDWEEILLFVAFVASANVS